MLLDLSGFFRIYITRGQTEHGEVRSVLKSSVYSLRYFSCHTTRRHKTIIFVLVPPSNILLYNPGQPLSNGETLMGYWLRPYLQVHGTTARSGPGSPHYRGYTITFSQTHHTRQDSSGRVISPTQRPVPSNTTLTGYRHPCLWWDSNPQSHHASGRRPTPWTARPLGSRHTKQSCRNNP